MKVQVGKSAFPNPPSGGYPAEFGMSLLDYAAVHLAAAAMTKYGYDEDTVRLAVLRAEKLVQELEERQGA